MIEETLKTPTINPKDTQVTEQLTEKTYAALTEIIKKTFKDKLAAAKQPTIRNTTEKFVAWSLVFFYLRVLGRDNLAERRGWPLILLESLTINVGVKGNLLSHSLEV